jgi:hypothetical protein
MSKVRVEFEMLRLCVDASAVRKIRFGDVICAPGKSTPANFPLPTLS